jgi:hypothetical protein
MREPIIRTIDRAANKRRDMRRSEEPISRELAYDNHVVIGKPEGRRFRRTAKSRPAGCDGKCLGVHTDIISEPEGPLPDTGGIATGVGLNCFPRA